MLQQFICTSAKAFNDTVEGTKYSNTKIGVLLPMKINNSETMKSIGQETTYIPFNDFAQFELSKLQDVFFPCLAELDIEMNSKGFVINSFKPLNKAIIVKT